MGDSLVKDATFSLLPARAWTSIFSLYGGEWYSITYPCIEHTADVSSFLAPIAFVFQHETGKWITHKHKSRDMCDHCYNLAVAYFEAGFRAQNVFIRSG